MLIPAALGVIVTILVAIIVVVIILKKKRRRIDDADYPIYGKITGKMISVVLVKILQRI